MKIRKATKEDLGALKEMAVEFEKEYLETQLSENSPYTSLNDQAEKIIKESMEKNFNSENKRILVAEENGEIMGHIMVSNDKIAGEIYNIKEIGSINFFRIKKEFRNKGIASALYNEAIKLLKQMGAEYVSVMTCKKNKDAYSFYKKAGFEEYEMEFQKKI